MASYADFVFYSTVYLGTAIAQADFPRLALRASEAVDRLTFNRASAIVTAATDTDAIDRIQKATCAIAEEIQKQDMTGVDGLTSERLGNYSVTYGEGAQAAMTNAQRLSNAARMYLGSTGLMFRGFAEGES